MSDHIQQAAEHRKGLLITAFGGLALTVDIPLIKLSEGEAWSVVATRGGMTFFAALVMWAGLRLFTSNRDPIIPGRTGLLVTGLYGIAAITFMLAVFHTTTANLVFILAFNPMFAALMGWLLIGEKPKPQTFVAMAAMIVGVALIVSDGLQAGNMIGNGLALFTSLLLSLIITISRKARTGMGFAPLIAAIVPCLVGLVIIGGPGGIVLPHPGWLALNGLVVIPIAFWCLATGPKYISGPGSGDVLPSRNHPGAGLDVADLFRGPYPARPDRRGYHRHGACCALAVATLRAPSRRSQPGAAASALKQLQPLDGPLTLSKF
jgi:drug/metabolite transporter (DMT)-like permease